MDNPCRADDAPPCEVCGFRGCDPGQHKQGGCGAAAATLSLLAETLDKATENLESIPEDEWNGPHGDALWDSYSRICKVMHALRAMHPACVGCGGKGYRATDTDGENPCKDCDGSGEYHVTGLPCPTCGGKGSVPAICEDSGRPVRDLCPACNGAGRGTDKPASIMHTSTEVVCACHGCNNGHCTALPLAACGREQKWLGRDAMEAIGWVQADDGAWRCPFCSGNEQKLRAVFDKPR